MELEGHLFRLPQSQGKPDPATMCAGASTYYLCQKKNNLGGDMTTPSRFIVLEDVHPFVCYFFFKDGGSKGLLELGGPLDDGRRGPLRMHVGG